MNQPSTIDQLTMPTSLLFAYFSNDQLSALIIEPFLATTDDLRHLPLVCRAFREITVCDKRVMRRTAWNRYGAKIVEAAEQHYVETNRSLEWYSLLQTDNKSTLAHPTLEIEKPTSYPEHGFVVEGVKWLRHRNRVAVYYTHQRARDHLPVIYLIFSRQPQERPPHSRLESHFFIGEEEYCRTCALFPVHIFEKPGIFAIYLQDLQGPVQAPTTLFYIPDLDGFAPPSTDEVNDPNYAFPYLK